MAMDSAEKRASAIGVGLAPLRPGVIPDGTAGLDVNERHHTNFLYADDYIEPEIPDVEIPLEIAWEETENPAPRFAFTSGEAVRLNITLDPAEDISDWTFRLDVRSSPYDSLAEETDYFSVDEVTVTDAAAGEFSIDMGTADTGDLEATLYQYLLYRTDQGDELLGRGLFRIHDAL